MYCNNCGKKVDDGILVCPDCNTQLPSNIRTTPAPMPRPVQAPVVTAQPVSAPKAKKASNPKKKGYAIIITAVLAFPSLLAFVTDYLGAPSWMHWLLNFFGIQAEQLQQGHMDWSLYFFGLIMCVWMAAVLPVLRPKRPAVVVCVCLAVVSLYLLLLACISSTPVLYRQWVLPVFLMVALSSAVMSILLSYKIVKNKHIATAVGVQLALFSLALEIVSDMNIRGAVNLRGSLIFSVVIVGLIIIYEAIIYTTKINKK